jgi:predicted Zn finger-like uncharacterized protein
MSLVTRCPKCKSAFQVVLDQLRIHDGLVRCGHCNHVFDGYSGLETELPTLTRLAEVGVGQNPSPLQVSDLNETVVSEPAPTVIRHRIIGEASDVPSPTLSNTREEPVLMHHRTETKFISDEPPIFVNAPDTSARDNNQQLLRSDPVGSDQDDLILNPPSGAWLQSDEEDTPPAVVGRILWALGIFTALGLLILQLLFVYRNDIALALPSARPVLKSVCEKIGCEVGYSCRLERISIEAGLVAVPGAAQDGQTSNLNLRMTMRNRYDQPQLWPNLTISLSDASGTVVVRKSVAPYQYLPSTLLDQPFAAGQEVNLVLPLSVTGFQITGFEINKFFP